MLAGVLQAEDTRQFNPAVLNPAARHPEPAVRGATALAMGRIGDRAAVPILIELLQDPDTAVQSRAAFALGMIGDTSAIGRLRELVLTTPPDDQFGVHAEAITALAKIGGPAALAVFQEVLRPWAGRASSSAPPVSVTTAVVESWRFGPNAPVEELIEFTVSPLRRTKIGAVYSLARLRRPEASDALLAATDSREDDMRAYAVRALSAAYADSAHLDRAALAARVRRLVSDNHPQVRVNALRALATYRDSTLAPAALDRLSDSDLNVRVQAVSALADLGGADAIAALRGHLDKGTRAIRREALMGLARLEGIHALGVIGGWLGSTDWQYRSVGATALGYIAQDTVVPWLVHMTRDPDPRVAAAALSSLAAVAPDAATARARELMVHPDAVVRAVAADRLASVPDTADVARLVQAYRLALPDSTPVARIAVLGALGAIADAGSRGAALIETRFFPRFPTSDDYVVRRAAERRFPEAARRWGSVTSITTGRGYEDYREIARQFVAPGGDRDTLLVIETDRGRILLRMFVEDAPLTMNAFFQLADRRYFDGSMWHRVVPNFVIQAGDPRGDGWGGPGYALRDEINLQRYERGTVGMALSGPDTGGSQFFITHSPQPHLDGTYTVIGRVLEGMDVVDLVTQGDRIRRIRRP